MSQAITDVLVTEGVISAEQLAEAEELVTVRGEPVLTVLIEQGAIARRDVVRYTVQAAGMEFVEIMDVPVDQEAVGMITGDQARRFGVIPIRIEGDDLVVVADSQTAMNWQIKDDLQTITKKNIKFACSIKSEIDSRINMLYRAEAELGSLMKDIMDEEPTVDVLAPVEDSSDAPLVKYVNLLLGQAIADKASDIHVEPNENHVRVRFRIDGVLKEMAPRAQGDPVRDHFSAQDHERDGHRRAPQAARRSLVGQVRRNQDRPSRVLPADRVGREDRHACPGQHRSPDGPIRSRLLSGQSRPLEERVREALRHAHRQRTHGLG